MPQATRTNSYTRTENPVVVALQVAASSLPPTRTQVGALSYQDAILRDACRSAAVTFKAMDALALSVADLPPSDPRHAAADAAIERLRPLWTDQVEQARTVPAVGPSGLRDKAELLVWLIDLDEDGSVPGNPVLSLAASLAMDVLLQHGTATP